MRQKPNFRINRNRNTNPSQHLSQHPPVWVVSNPRLTLLLSTLLLFSLSGCGFFQRDRQPLPAESPLASPPEASPPSTSLSPPTPSPAATNKPEFTLKLENQLNTVLAETLQTPVQSVACPIKTAPQVGDRFDCQVTATNQPFTVAVEITDTSGQFQWQTKGLLQLNKLEQFIQAQVREKGGGEVTAECGDSLRVAKVGETFDCQVTNAEGQKRSARVTVKDDKGSVDIALL